MRTSSRMPYLLAAMTLAVALAGCSGEGGGDGTGMLGSDSASDADAPRGEDEDGGDDAAQEEPSAEEFGIASGFTTGQDSIGTRYTSAGALLTNPNDDLAAYDVQVLFNLIGDDGDVLDSSTETVYYVAPGETVPVAPLQIGFDLKEVPTYLQVQVVGEFVDDGGPKGAFGGDGVVLKFVHGKILESDFGRELSAQVQNPTDAVIQYAQWSCVYLAGKKVLGGSSSAIIDPIPPGTTVEFGDTLSIDKLKPSTMECRVVADG